MATFSPVVAGLRRAYEADGNTQVAIDGLELTATQICMDYFEVPHVCPDVSSATHSFSIPLSGFFGAAEYYAVHVRIQGPLLDGADCVIQFAPTAPGPCSETGISSYDGTVSPGAWVKLEPDDPAGYVSVPSTFEADGLGGFEFPAVRWPDENQAAILVNAAPTLPVPVGFYDNYYTMALFEPGQLPASVDVEITHTNYLMRLGGIFRVGVLGYNATDDPPATGGQVMYVGAA